MSDVDPRLREQLQKGLIVALVVLGSACILAGVAVALGAAWIVYLLVEDPKRIAVVAALLGAEELRAFSGVTGNQPFRVEVGEPVFWLFAIFVGAIFLSVVTGLAKKLIGAGVELLAPVLAELRRTP